MNFKDFVPHATETHRNFLGIDIAEVTFESFPACVKAAQSWIAEKGIDVINVETVVLPNIYDPVQEGTIDTDLVSSKETRTHWYQFVRVWYR
jgi:hypothetical protein